MDYNGGWFRRGYELSESSQAHTGITRMDDLNGLPIQVSVYHDLAWHNLTVGDEFPVESPPVIHLDAYFRINMENALTSGGLVSVSETDLDGQKVLLFVFEIPYDPPQIVGGINQPVVRFRGQAYVEPSSGAILLLESIFITTGGEELVSLRTILVTIESGIQPPEELMLLMESQ